MTSVSTIRQAQVPEESAPLASSGVTISIPAQKNLLTYMLVCGAQRNVLRTKASRHCNALIGKHKRLLEVFRQLTTTASDGQYTVSCGIRPLQSVRLRTNINTAAPNTSAMKIPRKTSERIRVIQRAPSWLLTILVATRGNHKPTSTLPADQ